MSYIQLVRLDWWIRQAEDGGSVPANAITTDALSVITTDALDIITTG